jgi:hypothetical protein
MHFPKILSSLLAVSCLAIICVAPGHARAVAPTLTTLVSFNGADGYDPYAGLVMDANGNLFGITNVGGVYGLGTVFEIAKIAGGYATAPTTLVTFDGANGAYPPGGFLIIDANGDLLGTTEAGGSFGGSYGYGTVFEVAKTVSGYASTPTTLVNFNGSEGRPADGGLIFARAHLSSW